MKAFLLSSACMLMILTSSCNKTTITFTPNSGNTGGTGGTGGTATNTITFKANNVTQSYSGSAQSTKTSGFYTIGISGTSTANLIQVAVSSPEPVSAGTYNASSAATTTPLIVFYEGITSTNASTYGTDVSGTNPTTITITSITATNVQGTFSGVLMDESGGSATETITDGTFNVNIK